MYTRATLPVLGVFLSGPPGIGKTTVCKKLASMMEKENCKLDGFYTEEVRNERNNRIGFNIVLVKDPSKKYILARQQSVITRKEYSKCCVGCYHVFVKEFEEVAMSVLNSDADVYFIDEIGKMELFSTEFQQKVKLMISGGTDKNALIIATIPQKQPQRYSHLYQQIYANNRFKVIEVSAENRDRLPEEIMKLISFNK